MTDGTKYYNNAGEVVLKQYKDTDFTAIKMFKKLGIKVCFLSGDTKINKTMAHDRRIDFWDARLKDGSMDKIAVFKRIIKHYDVDESEVAYVGDDLYDIPLLRRCFSYSHCPYDAPQLVQYECKYISRAKCGQGVIMDMFQMWSGDFRNELPLSMCYESEAEAELNNDK